jgi:lysine 2,3-aminomutase
MSKIKSARTLREPAELVARGLVPAIDLPDLEKVAARYAVAVTADIAALIDPRDPNDPIARQFIPSAEELVTASLSRSGAIQAGSHLRGILPFLFSPRNGRSGQGDRALACRL